ncbi:MAG: fluoroquinolone transporter permease [Streptosporangiales bacterium]|nr:fluoroquinolone transporter permease [Streptosporangiales bacterium]
MTRLGTVLRLEVRLQWRYRFLQAGVFSGVMWLALLLPLPHDLRSTAEPYVILGDLAIVGWFFIAGAVFLEKGDRTLNALVATPMRFVEYLLAKMLTLVTLSTVLAVFVATVTHGVGYDLRWLLLGAVLGTALMLTASFLSSMPFSSISNWFMPSVGPLAVMTLPVFYLAGLWPTRWLYLVPTMGPLLFLGAAFDQVSLTGWQVGYGVLYPLAFLGLMYLPARRMFEKYVVAKTGGA